MSPANVKVGVRVRDLGTRQVGVVAAKFKPANPNVESDLVAIRVHGNAIVWSNASSLEEQMKQQTVVCRERPNKPSVADRDSTGQAVETKIQISGRNPMRFKQFKKSLVDGREVVEIVLFRKLGTKLYREMPLVLNEAGEKVFGQTWKGYWWRICHYPIRWNFSSTQ